MTYHPKQFGIILKFKGIIRYLNISADAVIYSEKNLSDRTYQQLERGLQENHRTKKNTFRNKN